MENRNLVFIPTWVKFSSFAVIAAILICSVVFILHFMGRSGHETWVLVGMSAAQMAGSGLILFLVVAFSQRDATFGGVQQQVDSFLEEVLPRTFLSIDTPDASPRPFKPHRLPRLPSRRTPRSNVSVDILHNRGELGASYLISTPKTALRIFVELNVWKLVVVYYMPAETDEFASKLRERLQFSFPSAGIDGFSIEENYSHEAFDGRHYLNIIMKKSLPEEFVQSNLQKLYVANLIMTHTQSLIRNCGRDGIPLNYQSKSNA
ncbi:hypothetical protein [Henriciella sp.]|uniref:hypothetical protein n=1 Tax=Henriciella sp. TaxID=1968823 RepID=UPI00260683A0|nr:hypothetical protein [Henriciella sp.]